MGGVVLDADLTITIKEYERKTWGARHDTKRFPNERTHGFDLMRAWEDKAPGRVGVPESVKVRSEPYYKKLCGEAACVHCPEELWYANTFTWHGFESVAPEHIDTVRAFGETRSIVRVPVIPPISIAR